MITDLQPEAIIPGQAPLPPEPKEPYKEPKKELKAEMGQFEQDFNTMLEEMKTKAGELFQKQEEVHNSTLAETTGKLKEDHKGAMEKTTTKMGDKHGKDLAKKEKEINTLKEKLAKETEKVKILQAKVKEALA